MTARQALVLGVALLIGIVVFLLTADVTPHVPSVGDLPPPQSDPSEGGSTLTGLTGSGVAVVLHVRDATTHDAVAAHWKITRADLVDDSIGSTQGTTGVDGQSTLRLPAGFEGKIHILAAGHTPSTFGLSVPPVAPGVPVDVTFLLGGTARLIGQVGAPEGMDIGAGWVDIVAATGELGEVEVSVPLGGTGSFVVDHLPPGNCSASTRGPWAQEQNVVAELELQPGDNHVSMRLRRRGPKPGVIEGSIDLNSASSEEWVVYWRRAMPPLLGRSLVQPDGRFVLRVPVASETYELFLRPLDALGPLSSESGTRASGGNSGLNLEPDELDTLKLKIVGDGLPSDDIPLQIVGPELEGGGPARAVGHRVNLVSRSSVQHLTTVRGAKQGATYHVYVGPLPDGRFGTWNGRASNGMTAEVALRPGSTAVADWRMPKGVSVASGFAVIRNPFIEFKFDLAPEAEDIELPGLADGLYWSIELSIQGTDGIAYSARRTQLRLPGRTSVPLLASGR
ncbi:MAG: hypothetical protein H6806_12870 [Planctomycetes bacterium]|nr:hypothetical protein [Planctomycetota bacterium]MCB9825181.1 hypothetical protein [Planctomycetota bacterium]MCB9830636.1 hypothetical protein [Planctomycetota bacterium]